MSAPTPTLSRRMNDAALAALAYVNAYQDRDPLAMEVVQIATSREDLLLGMLLLVGNLRTSLAASYGVAEAEVDGVVRAMYQPASAA